MSTLVHRLVTAHAAAQGLRQPDVFERTTFIVHEIDEAALKAVAQVVKLRAARASGDRAGMQAAVAELSKLGAQTGWLVAALGRVLANDENRS